VEQRTVEEVTCGARIGHDASRQSVLEVLDHAQRGDADALAAPR
jgi:major membrane immunogen (membrane-anchored lipoprotein)